MHTILVPLDGSNHSLKALRIACDLAEKYDGRIALLHVLDLRKQADELAQLALANKFGPQLRAALTGADGTLPVEVIRQVGQTILDDGAARAKHRGVETQPLDLESGDPAESILIARQRTGASTIVMGCRGASQSDTGSFGSVSSTVFERAECACISVK